METYARLEAVSSSSNELLSYRYDLRLARLYQGIQTALAPYTHIYQDLEQGASWLRDIARILEPSTDRPTIGQQVAQQLDIYLDDLYELHNLSPRLNRFRHHLDKVSSSYWPGLFHCYDPEGLPRTKNELESHFRDTQRRLLRTNGQKGQTRRALQRIGAWELLARANTEVECLAVLPQVTPSELAREQQRFRRQQERFRLHTRSIRRANAQLDRLRQQWLAFVATSTGWLLWHCELRPLASDSLSVMRRDQAKLVLL